MREFMLLIFNEINNQAAWSPEQHQQFLGKCKDYIEYLKHSGKLISAQPLVTDGKIISHVNGRWREVAFNETKEIMVGYYHIHAIDLSEAISIAQGNPEFEYGNTARVEIRPVKTKEESTGYVYPSPVG